MNDYCHFCGNNFCDHCRAALHYWSYQLGLVNQVDEIFTESNFKSAQLCLFDQLTQEED